LSKYEKRRVQNKRELSVKRQMQMLKRCVQI